MIMMTDAVKQQIGKARQLMAQNSIDEAIKLLTAVIDANPDADEAFFVRGTAYHRQGQVRLAISDYCQAKLINPDSPASQAYDAAIEVLNFFNTDLYNP